MVRFVIAFLSGMMLPLTLYPEWLQKFISYTPFPSMVYIPIQLAMGRAGFDEFINSSLILMTWGMPLLAVWYWVWRSGLKQYTGVGQ